ncbi:MAG: hypothetical protein HYV60_14090 [Planctomycetia bacterium]|nr:hypothetical protein [Planctomycetia bacterium]
MHEPPAAVDVAPAGSDKSQRSMIDATAEMGVACTRPEERVPAAMGMLQGAPTRFENCRGVNESWREEEFVETQVTLPCGETVSLKLAERGSWIRDKKNDLWVREIRKFNASGHQTSLISRDYHQLAVPDAAGLSFAEGQTATAACRVRRSRATPRNRHRRRAEMGATQKRIGGDHPAARTRMGGGRELFRSEADLTPDLESGELRIGVHSLSNPRSNRAIEQLLAELNASELTYPGTTLKLDYTLHGSPTR